MIIGSIRRKMKVQFSSPRVTTVATAAVVAIILLLISLNDPVRTEALTGEFGVSGAEMTSVTSSAPTRAYETETHERPGIKLQQSLSFSSVSAGGIHICGLRTDGSVSCWGGNEDGQSDAPDGLFSSVSAGPYHTCGVRTDGSVVCWGYNSKGQSDAPSGSFSSVSAGNDHTCGVRTDGTLACWGDNEDGQSNAPSGSFSSVSAGSGAFRSHTCGVRTDGTVACWGNSGNGQSDAPADSFSSASAGRVHTCGVRIDGTVACWGDDRHGQSSPPVGTFSTVNAGDYHTCGVKTDGTVACWGNNGSGQSDAPDGSFSSVSAGSGHFSSHTCAVRTDGSVTCWGNTPDGSFSSVSAGSGHICGLRTDRSIACWGYNNNGQSDAPDGLFSSVSVGSGFTCGLRFDSSVSCWGYNYDGRSDAPGGSFSSVSAGGAHTCGVKMDGTVACWGNNGSGQLDASDGSFSSVSAGIFHTCGVKTDSTVACWGNNGNGRSDAPDGSFSSVSAGSSHTCGLSTDGSISCWGHNDNGQSDAPDGSFSSVSAGSGFTCGLRPDSSVSCWGYNSDGRSDAPGGSFSSVSASGGSACGIRTNGSVSCWGRYEYDESIFHYQTEEPPIHPPETQTFVEDFEGEFDSNRWLLWGTAEHLMSNGIIQLTPASRSKLGLLLHKNPVSSEGLSLAFSFEIGGGTGADGLAFALLRSSPDSSGLDPSLDEGGSWGSRVLDGFLVTFDTFRNRPGIDARNYYYPINDPSSNFVALAELGAREGESGPNGSVLHDITHLATTDLSLPLRNTGVFDAEVTFGEDGVIEVYLSNAANGMDRTLVIQHTIENFTHFNGYFGFLGTTGGATDRHVIHSVSYGSDDSATTNEDDCATVLTEDGSVDGTWGSECVSESRQGRYARYYTFRLLQQSDVTITLQSDALEAGDTYLYLRQGEDQREGDAYLENDDHEDDNSNDFNLPSHASGITATLQPGYYTIEATTFYQGETGAFTLTLNGIGATAQPTIPASGRIAFTSTRDIDVDIHVMDVAAGNVASVTRLTDDAAYDWEASWSPDEDKIAFTSITGRREDGNWDIYVMNANGSAITRLTDNTAKDDNPSWSPDGISIAFTSERDGNEEIYVMNADGTGLTRLTNNNDSDWGPSWSPDGQQIAFVSSRDGNDEIYRMNANGTDITRLTDESEADWAPNWSPNGQDIAFSSSRDNRRSNAHDIYVIDNDGINVERLTNNGVNDSDPSWSPDGGHIAFTSERDGNIDIYVVDVESKNESRLTSHAADDSQPDWSPVMGSSEMPPPDDEPFEFESELSAEDVEVGESITLTVELTGAQAAGGNGGISVSFPSLTADADDSVSGNVYSSPAADVEIVSYSTGLGNVTFHRPGEDYIHQSTDDRRFLARDLLVESDDTLWSRGGDRRLVLRITPNQVPDDGVFEILVRGWVCNDEYTDCTRQPARGDTPDQQGWPAEELPVRVSDSTPVVCETHLTEDIDVDEKWDSRCPSRDSDRSSRYAHYYTFTLTEAAEVTIILESDKDTYLYLLERSGQDDTTLLCQNDDYGTRLGGLPCDVIDFELASGVDSAIVATLDPGDYLIEATTFGTGVTGDFTLGLSGLDSTAPPSSQPLSLEVKDFQTHAEVGQPYTLTLQMLDIQRTGEHGGISVSFPLLTEDDGRSGNLYTSSAADIEVVSGERPVSNVKFYRNNGTDFIHRDPGNERIHAQHLLVESDEAWAPGDDRTLTLRITPKLVPEGGTFPIRIRSWICNEEAGEYTNCSRYPSDGTPEEEDQQGQYAEEFIVDVIPAPPILENPELHATLQTCGLGEQESLFAQPGETIRLSARVDNESAGILGANLYVVFQFYGSDGEQKSSVNSRIEHVLKGSLYEFTYDRMAINRLDAYEIVCTLIWRSGNDYRLQDYSGRANGISNGDLTIEEGPVDARRLLDDSSLPGRDWHVNARMWLPTENEPANRLSFTIEDTDTGLMPYSSVILNLSMPETIWIDYGGITKWVSSYDGRYTQYIPQWEERVAEELSVIQFVFSLLPKPPEVTGTLGVLEFFDSLIFADQLQSVDGERVDNCRDELTIRTLVPRNVRFAESSNKLPKRIRVEIPLYSLMDDDYISSTITHRAVGFTSQARFDDLLKSGVSAPVCERPQR